MEEFLLELGLDPEEDDRPLDVSSEFLEMTIQEIKKVASRSRKKRKKLVIKVVNYIEKLSDEASKHVKNNEIMQGIIERFDVLTQLFTETLRLLLPLSDQSSELEETSGIATKFGDALEMFIRTVNMWCLSGDERPCFVSITAGFLTELLNVIAANTDSWFYSAVIASPLAIILWNWGDKEVYAERRLEWSNNSIRVMYELAKKVMRGGDFSCQYGLIILIQQWLRWMQPTYAVTFLNTAFSSVDPGVRNLLMDEGPYDFDYCARSFLNTLNSSPRGPKLVNSISCQYFFVGEDEIKSPDHKDIEDFWIDFCYGSRRIHVLCSIPNNGWVDLNIRADQIDSVCVSWVPKDRSKSQSNTQRTNTQMSTTSHSAYNSLTCLHIYLKDEFANISNQLFQYSGEIHRSLFIFFKEMSVVERALDRMRLPVHPFGEKCCGHRQLQSLLKRPPTGNQSFSQAWSTGLQSMVVKDEPHDDVSYIESPVDSMQDEESLLENEQGRLELDHPQYASMNRLVENDKNMAQIESPPGGVLQIYTPGTSQSCMNGAEEDENLNSTSEMQTSARFCTTPVDENFWDGKELPSANNSHDKSGNVRVLETPGGFYPEDSFQDELMESDVDSWDGGVKSSILNLSTMTAESYMEDPLPRSCRKIAMLSRPRTPFKSMSRLLERSPEPTNSTMNNSAGKRSQSIPLTPFSKFHLSQRSSNNDATLNSIVENMSSDELTPPVLKSRLVFCSTPQTRTKSTPDDEISNLESICVANSEILTDFSEDEVEISPLPPMEATPNRKISNAFTSIRRSLETPTFTLLSDKVSNKESSKSVDTRPSTPFNKSVLPMTPIIRPSQSPQNISPIEAPHNVEEMSDEENRLYSSPVMKNISIRSSTPKPPRTPTRPVGTANDPIREWVFAHSDLSLSLADELILDPPMSVVSSPPKSSKKDSASERPANSHLSISSDEDIVPDTPIIVISPIINKTSETHSEFALNTDINIYSEDEAFAPEIVKPRRKDGKGFVNSHLSLSSDEDIILDSSKSFASSWKPTSSMSKGSVNSHLSISSDEEIVPDTPIIVITPIIDKTSETHSESALNTDINIYSEDEAFAPEIVKPRRKDGKGFVGGRPKNARTKKKNKQGTMTGKVPKALERSIQNVLPVKPINPVPKVMGRVPCYSNSAFLMEPVADKSLDTQFVDPYDFERNYDFITSKNKMKTYKRKRKRSNGTRQTAKKIAIRIEEDQDSSDDSINAIIEKLPSKKSGIKPKRAATENVKPKRSYKKKCDGIAPLSPAEKRPRGRPPKSKIQDETPEPPSTVKRPRGRPSKSKIHDETPELSSTAKKSPSKIHVVDEIPLFPQETHISRPQRPQQVKKPVQQKTVTELTTPKKHSEEPANKNALQEKARSEASTPNRDESIDSSDDWCSTPNPLYFDGLASPVTNTSEHASVNNQMDENDEQCISPETVESANTSRSSVYIQPPYFSPMSVASCFSFAHEYRRESESQGTSESTLSRAITKQNTESNAKPAITKRFVIDCEDEDKDFESEEDEEDIQKIHSATSDKLKASTAQPNPDLEDSFDWDNLSI